MDNGLNILISIFIVDYDISVSAILLVSEPHSLEICCHIFSIIDFTVIYNIALIDYTDLTPLITVLHACTVYLD